MELRFQFHKLWQIETRKWLLVVGAVAVTYILFQFLLLPYGNALGSLLPHSNDPLFDKSSFLLSQSSAKSGMERNPLTVELNKGYILDGSVLRAAVYSSRNVSHNSGSKRNSEGTENGFKSEHEDLDNPIQLADDDDEDTDSFVSEKDDLDNPIELVVDRSVQNDFPSERVMNRNWTFTSESIKNQESSSIIESANGAEHGLPLYQNLKSNNEIPTDNILEVNKHLPRKKSWHLNIAVISPPVESHAAASFTNITNLRSNGSSSDGSAIQKNGFSTSKNISAKMDKPGRKKMRCEMPPKSITLIDEMDHILARNRRSSRAMRPRWSSPRDREILAARSQIENAPVVLSDRDLYPPLFRNVSQFKRSYELMERTLKVYIYKDGKKPIFHLPILKGLYASEGWFMKLMQGNKHFIVKDPRRAHLLYMPFSSRMLEYTLYVRNSHNRTNLRQYMKEYSDKIAAKYTYFNRTGGADHFLVACHDWAPYETRHHMEHCIKALCNADVTAGFKIGRDVSLPETYVRSARNPLRDLGGKPPSQRNILAFYAGSMHGYLRPMLLEYWKGKDPSMKIFGPMPPGVASKMNYIQHMKSSKYCICPKGYEVNSPRVVEAIFYECVPVIISDNFVPPFFEVFNWGAFSVILAEKDIPNLKEILLSIPEEKYLQMQLGVRKVQRHFLWHANPVKYDLFYMTLHSIWYNRVYQIKPR